MTAISNLTGALGLLDSTSLRFRPKTRDAISNGRAVAQAFEEVSEDDRAQCRQSLNSALGAKLLALSGFMAEAAINERDASWLRVALTLHAIEDFRKDYRENFRYLVLLAYASEQLGASLETVVDIVSHVSSERARAFFSDFNSRNRSLNRLEAIGIRADIVDGGIRFVPA